MTLTNNDLDAIRYYRDGVEPEIPGVSQRERSARLIAMRELGYHLWNGVPKLEASRKFRQAFEREFRTPSTCRIDCMCPKCNHGAFETP